MLGIGFDKLLVMAGIAVILIGPTRLPGYAEKLGQFVRNLRRFADDARDKVREEVGSDVFDEIDWKKLDPRQYDPRRIIADALLSDDDDAAEPEKVVGIPAVATKPAPAALAAGALPPFDAEAT
ncbi:twin-arginine translocase TatA/TatE family subunit [Gryllotalpicola koreensis]|uniref:Sec-independent protein translocase TatB n=1 Tax=Gryllotalpicola koreensis TaxID=993086 RepID=A0ABP8A8A2_9MICO